MPRRIIDLSLTIEDNMPAHKNFQRPVLTTHFSHESSALLNQGVPGDRGSNIPKANSGLSRPGAACQGFHNPMRSARKTPKEMRRTREDFQ
jgi:hypothetical protein